MPGGDDCDDQKGDEQQTVTIAIAALIGGVHTTREIPKGEPQGGNVFKDRVTGISAYPKDVLLVPRRLDPALVFCLLFLHGVVTSSQTSDLVLFSAFR